MIPLISYPDFFSCPVHYAKQAVEGYISSLTIYFTTKCRQEFHQGPVCTGRHKGKVGASFYSILMPLFNKKPQKNQIVQKYLSFYSHINCQRQLFFCFPCLCQTGVDSFVGNILRSKFYLFLLISLSSAD